MVVSIGENDSGGRPRLRGVPSGSPRTDRRGVETGAGPVSGAPVHPVGFDATNPDSEGFRVLADASPVGIAHLDEDGAVAYVNPRWREMTGGNLNSGGDPLEILHPDDRERALAELDWRQLRPALLMMGMYEKILTKLENRRFALSDTPVKLSRFEKIFAALRYGLAPPPRI